MKRDWDAIRDILLAVEARETDNDPLIFETSYTDQKIVYHLELLIEANLINGERVTLGLGPESFHIKRLSWDGHQFLDSIRDNGIWSKTKKKVTESGAGVTFEILKTVAISVAKDALGIE
jgi:hypothetical protein